MNTATEIKNVSLYALPDTYYQKLKAIKRQQEEKLKLCSNPHEVIGLVSDFYNVTQDQILSHSRIRGLVWPRHVAMFMLRKCGYTFKRIGVEFKRDHTSIIHACTTVKNIIQFDSLRKDEVDFLISKI